MKWNILNELSDGWQGLSATLDRTRLWRTFRGLHFASDRVTKPPLRANT